jgi:tripartite-type tricarboxylate transporter receptor subunit TctC
VAEALKSPEVQKFSNAAGMDSRSMSPDDLHNRIKVDVARWPQVFEKAAIKKR